MTFQGVPPAFLEEGIFRQITDKTTNSLITNICVHHSSLTTIGEKKSRAEPGFLQCDNRN